MRFRLNLKLENKCLPVQYRKNILSFMKLSLSKYNEEYYKKLYNEKDTIIKPYTFAVFFNKPVFNGEEIIIEDKKFNINFSVSDYEIAVALYNAFNHQKNVKFSIKNNSWTLENITMLNEKKIDTESLKIKFLSPLVVRSRENEKDYYYSYEISEFEDTLKINIKEQLKITNIPQEAVETFKINVINAKKVIVKFYEKKMECSVGTFEISGDKELLKTIYQMGLGSRRSSGFGMFEIL